MIEYLVSLSLLICVVLLIRGIFRKTVSPRAIYALWLVVVIRMLLPITLFEVDVTLPEFLQSQQAEQSEQLPEDSGTSADMQEQSPTISPIQTTPTYPSKNPASVIPVTPVTPAVPTETTPAAPIIPETEVVTSLAPEEPISKVPEEPVSVNWKRIADLVWFIGAVITAIWVLFTSIIYNGRLMKERRLHRTVRGTKVYVSEGAGVPCIAGLIPSIYITPEAANSKSEMLIIIHEHVHLRHLDHIWSVIRALALIVFWWNPLVWAAATVSKLDAELACDDAISAKLNDATRLKYAHILLDTIPQKHRYATGLGSAPMKERILMLTKRQKNRWICMILAVVLTVSAVGCSFIGTRKITMDNIQEQNGFTILSQETKEITLTLPLEQLPTYDDIVSAEGARFDLDDIPVFTTDTTEVFLHTAGVSGHEPEGTDKDKLYLGFDIRHNLTDSGTVYTVNRVMNENGSNTYSPEVSVTEETLEEYERKILHMGSGPNDQFYLYIDADLYTTLQGNVSIGITLNEIIYERGSEVKTYGLNAAEDDTSEPDRNEQQTETFISMEAYVTDRMAKETTAQYFSYGPDGKSISSQPKTANVIDTKLLRLEKKGELTGLAAEGILECWEYEYLIKLDVPTEEVIPVGGQYGEDGWFDLTGQGNHITVSLRYPDNTYTVLRDTCIGDGIDFMGYHDTYEEAIYDWYVKEYGLDLPLYVQDWADKITVPDGGHLGNQPVHRFDGDGWSIYIPLSAWYQSTDAGENEWLWRSSYLTGSTLLVEAFSDAMESETQENTQANVTNSFTYYYDNPNGGFWRVTTTWTDEGITDYPYIAIEPQLLRLMAESFFVIDEESAEAKDLSQGPFIGFVESKDTPWIQLYTEKDGIYVGRIPYEIFHDWIAADRNSEGWSPGWQPEYMSFYYAEFDDFRWAAAHLTNTVMGSGRKNVATSTDGGNTWNYGSTADDYGGNHVVGIGFASESIAFMSFDPYNELDGADGPIISRTTDGGNTWELLNIPLQESQKGTKLISGIPFYDGDLLRYPVWLNPSHGTKEGAVMYLISLDCGLTWEWEKQNSNISKVDALSAYKNANPGNSFVYEGYTVEYECESPYGGKFDFHIHLPQLNSDAPNAQKWNTLYQEYENEFGEQLRKTVYDTNTEYYAHITYDTVTTGDVLTIYIVKSHGILASGASTMDYDIYHYNMKEDRFLSTDEFIAYYAEGQFADYSVADIVKFMNENGYTTDEAGNSYPLTEENILGVIPSVYGDGKFDVVYRGYTMEGYHATRMLFSPYPTYGSKHQYTYRLTYHDYVDCEDKEMYGTPVGYRLLISQRVVGEYDAGYYVDCLFTEDIAEPPESYPLSEHGGYYTPVQEDAYGNMYMVIDHETDWGHLSAWIPFDMPDTAQDYYWGIHNKYFSYDRILDGTNYQVNRNIAAQVAEVLDAYRNGKDPNELFPASKTEYTPYPLDTIRENPTVEEIGKILKNTSVGESGIINFDIDLGDGWRMALPMDIAGFGDGAQAYFTGVYFAHGTPLEQEVS